MANDDRFGFGAAAQTDDLDLSAFAPKPKRIDRSAAAAASEVAQGAGFSRRASPARSAKSGSKAPAPDPEVMPAKSRGKRVNVRELPGSTDRYIDVDKAQLNMLVPVPVFLRWRELCKTAGGPAWEVLERAIEALEVEGPKAAGGRS